MLQRGLFHLSSLSTYWSCIFSKHKFLIFMLAKNIYFFAALLLECTDIHVYISAGTPKWSELKGSTWPPGLDTIELLRQINMIEYACFFYIEFFGTYYRLIVVFGVGQPPSLLQTTYFCRFK